tara:strand:+ start:627 stop:896 length:270 start_codon:yes stop_codon:yes gene_type:complete
MTQQPQSEERSWTYTTEEGRYEVDKLSEEGQQAIKLLLETDKDARELNKKVAIHAAALAQIRTIIEKNLTEEALIEEKIEEEDEEDLSN